MKKKSKTSSVGFLETSDMSGVETIDKGFLSSNLYDVDVVAWKSETREYHFLANEDAALEYMGYISFNDDGAHIAFRFGVGCNTNKMLDQKEKEEALERINNLQRLVNEFAEQAKKDINYCDETNAMKAL